MHHAPNIQVDLNAPLSKDSPPTVTDATRLSAACPTITFLADKGAKVILASHLGRPKKKVVDDLRMDPVAAKLSELLGKEVRVVLGRVGGWGVRGKGTEVCACVYLCVVFLEADSLFCLFLQIAYEQFLSCRLL